MTSRTVFTVLQETSQLEGAKLALQQPYTEKGERKYSRWTWDEYRTVAGEIAAGLRSIGIGPGDIVASCTETRAEFYLADLGIMANGSIAAALYPSYPPKDLLHTLAALGARAAFVENPKIFESLRSAPVGHWILLTGRAEGALTLDELRAMGRAALARGHSPAGAAPSDPAVLYLTSGATGEPKMALVTHQAICANIAMGPAVRPLGPED